MIFVFLLSLFVFVFFFNDTATTEIYTLSLHDALPISARRSASSSARRSCAQAKRTRRLSGRRGPRSTKPDRKSTRLNSSHMSISYAVFCLKKKNTSRQHYKLAAITRTLFHIPKSHKQQ